MVTTHFEERSGFSPEEQQAWIDSQNKLGEAQRVAHHGQMQFTKADDSLSKAEAAHREANEAAARQAEHERELNRHQSTLDSLKGKDREAHHAASREAEERLVTHQQAQQKVGQAELLAAEKENVLRDHKHGLEQHHAHHRSLEEKLAQHRGLTKEREAEHKARQHEHHQLRSSHDANLKEVERLMREHDPLRKEIEEHETRLHHLRKRHDDGQRAIYAAKDKANQSHQRLHAYDPDLHNHAMQALEDHKNRERELAEQLAAAKHNAHSHQHRHDSALAEHKKALSHLETLQGRAPGDKDLAQAQAARDAAHAKLADLDRQAKESHGLFKRHQAGSEEHGRRAAELQALAERHSQAYTKFRSEGDDAVARKEALWNEAKNSGDTGLGHFREKVTGLDGRHETLTDKIKGALTGDKTRGTTSATTHSSTTQGVPGMSQGVIGQGTTTTSHHSSHHHGTGIPGVNTTTSSSGPTGTTTREGGIDSTTTSGHQGLGSTSGTHAGLGKNQMGTSGTRTGLGQDQTTTSGTRTCLGQDQITSGTGTHTGVGQERTTTTTTGTGAGTTSSGTRFPSAPNTSHTTDSVNDTTDTSANDGSLKSKIKGLFGK